jgi:hypothetical protein
MSENGKKFLKFRQEMIDFVHRNRQSTNLTDMDIVDCIIANYIHIKRGNLK